MLLFETTSVQNPSEHYAKKHTLCLSPTYIHLSTFTLISNEMQKWNNHQYAMPCMLDLCNSSVTGFEFDNKAYWTPFCKKKVYNP